MRNISFDWTEDEFLSVDRKGLLYRDCEGSDRINQQNLDIAGAAHHGRDDLDEDDGDRRLVFGYTNDQTPDLRRTPLLARKQLARKWLGARCQNRRSVTSSQHLEGPCVEPDGSMD